MKKLLFFVVSCLLFVGCGTTNNQDSSDELVTREEVDEIVEQKIQEYEPQSEESNEEQDEDVIYTKDGRFSILVSADTDEKLVNALINYSSYDISEQTDGYVHTFKMNNLTDKTISTIQLGIMGSMLETCSIDNIAPGEEMIFEFHASTDEYPETILVNEVFFEE